MDKLPYGCDPGRYGLDPAEIRDVSAIHEHYGHRLYRIECGRHSHILKWFLDPGQAHEVRAYSLLRHHSVPTLPVHGQTEDGLLLEDLDNSVKWRLATELDIEDAETGVAVASWYRVLHASGRAALTDPTETLEWLTREADVLSPSSILTIGQRLGQMDNPVWKLAADHVGQLQRAARSMQETLNYNDFHWSNLALSRAREPVLQAIVFDYHLLGIGMAYSDCRNVAWSLGAKARDAFWKTYGALDEREAILDKPLATLCALQVALEQLRFPDWAEESLEMAKGGELEHDLRRAVETFLL